MKQTKLAPVKEIPRLTLQFQYQGICHVKIETTYLEGLTLENRQT